MKPSVDPTTLATYNRSASEFAHYFAGIGPRVTDIERAFELAGNPEHARVVELGCGDGRDAAEIVTRVAFYCGFDPSSGLLDIARRRLPKAQFIEGEAGSFSYPPELDVVFAFASLLHVTRNQLPAALRRIKEALRPGGILYLTLKERPTYIEEDRRDRFGIRRFAYYSTELLLELAGRKWTKVFEHHGRRNDTDWLTLALRNDGK